MIELGHEFHESARIRNIGFVKIRAIRGKTSLRL